MKKINMLIIGCLLSSTLGISGMYFGSDYEMPEPTKRKEVKIPRFFSEGYIKSLSTDEIEELIALLNSTINTATGRALKKYQKMKEFAENILSRYKTYADRM